MAIAPRPLDLAAVEDLLDKRTPPSVDPNVADPAAERAGFSWADAAARLDGAVDATGAIAGRCNMAQVCVARHAAGARADHPALRFVGRDGHVHQLTYRELDEQVRRFASSLDRLGVPPGSRVFALLDRRPAAWITALGTLAHGSVFCPLFSAFGPEPVRQRIDRGEGAVLVTTKALHRRKVAPVREELPGLEHVLLADDEPSDVAGTHHLGTLLAEGDPAHPIADTGPDDPALLHFTSGTTGMPKGALHVHGAAVVHHETGRSVLDLHPDDVYWCTADPGWVTGTSYGIVSPLAHGVTCVVDEADFDAERWYRLLAEQGVTVWYTAPTAIRMLMRAGDELAQRAELPGLRHVCSVGEPLNAEAVRWAAEHLGVAVHDTWWQTETGGMVIANVPAEAVTPGSMGRPLPGMEVALLARDGDGEPVLDGEGRPVVVPVDQPGREGEIAIRTPWPSMFRGYLHEEARTAKAFVGDWYRSGDLATRDEQGRWWFVGRGDDVIKSAGHLIGPFEVESVLMEHPAVVEAAAIGLPDPTAGDVIKAFVTLGPGYEASDELALELKGHARTHLGPAVAPREVAFAADLPHTRSGKIMRRLLRARELGLPEGDLSTLEPSS